MATKTNTLNAFHSHLIPIYTERTSYRLFIINLLSLRSYVFTNPDTIFSFAFRIKYPKTAFPIFQIYTIKNEKNKYFFCFVLELPKQTSDQFKVHERSESVFGIKWERWEMREKGRMERKWKRTIERTNVCTRETAKEVVVADRNRWRKKYFLSLRSLDPHYKHTQTYTHTLICIPPDSKREMKMERESQHTMANILGVCDLAHLYYVPGSHIYQYLRWFVAVCFYFFGFVLS